jgi:hypothetical protein
LMGNSVLHSGDGMSEPYLCRGLLRDIGHPVLAESTYGKIDSLNHEGVDYLAVFRAPSRSFVVSFRISAWSSKGGNAQLVFLPFKSIYPILRRR